jgi:hypothetical protein
MKFKRFQNEITNNSFLLTVVMAKRKECVIGDKKIIKEERKKFKS